MNRNLSLLFAFVATMLARPMITMAESAIGEQPNVVFIISDDLGAQSLALLRKLAMQNAKYR